MSDEVSVAIGARIRHMGTEEFGSELESKYGFSDWDGEKLIRRQDELRPSWDLAIATGFDDIPEADKPEIDEYLHVSQYMRTPQGKRKQNEYMSSLHKKREEFQPLPEWIDKTVIVVKEFEETRSHCPIVGSVGKVKRQSLKVDAIEPSYVLLWVEFPYPMRTKNAYFLSYEEYMKLEPDDHMRLFQEHGVEEIWCGREDESAFTVGFRVDEIEVVP